MCKLCNTFNWLSKCIIPQYSYVWLTSHHQHSPGSGLLGPRVLWTGKGYSTDVDGTVIGCQPVDCEGDLILCQILPHCKFVCLICAPIQADGLWLVSPIAKPQVAGLLVGAPHCGEGAEHGHSHLSVVHFENRWLKDRDRTLTRSTCGRKTTCASILLIFVGSETPNFFF